MTHAADNLLDLVENTSCTRDEVVGYYRTCLSGADQIDWPAINAAILARWSPSGLAYIKKRAWEEDPQGALNAD